MKHIHHWQLDAKSYGKCQCGAEQDFQIKEKKNRSSWVSLNFQTEFYNQGGFTKRVR